MVNENTKILQIHNAILDVLDEQGIASDGVGFALYNIAAGVTSIEAEGTRTSKYLEYAYVALKFFLIGCDSDADPFGVLSDATQRVDEQASRQGDRVTRSRFRHAAIEYAQNLTQEGHGPLAQNVRGYVDGVLCRAALSDDADYLRGWRAGANAAAHTD